VALNAVLAQDGLNIASEVDFGGRLRPPGEQDVMRLSRQRHSESCEGDEKTCPHDGADYMTTLIS
jgi:hypothetical protein